MIELLFSSPLVLLFVLMAAIASVVIGAVVVLRAEFQRRNLPAATEWIDLSEQISRKKSEIADLILKLEALRRQIEDRDRLVGELAALQERIEATNLEYASLGDARKQIDEVKRLAADAAADLSKCQSAIADATESRDVLLKEVANLEDACASNARELKGLIEEIEKRKAELGELPKELHDAIAKLQQTRDGLTTEIDVLRAEHSRLLAERTEFVELAALKSTLAAQISGLKEELDQSNRGLENANLAKQEIHKALTELNTELARLHAARSETHDLRATKAQLEAEITRLGKETSGGQQPWDEQVLDDLRQPPDLLKRQTPAYRPKSEPEALNDVRKHLDNLHLAYPDRIIKAFHTSLKINDFAQLTVLAGVSGTGKSLLPRRYAEAMGIRFLPFAVEPRWDSPQDLLGFYNYIEKRYRATDLARALVHLDPYDTSGLLAQYGNNGEQRDTMMLVLLDEMNLARVEYYFSEFLSRLESRPAYSNELTFEQRRDALIPIDIRGREQQGPVRLYPSHNMLFVGTMNDDESTQSLSDKVLDRSNIMQFAAPDDFAQAKDTSNVMAPDRSLSFLTWRSWVKQPEKMDEAANEKTRVVIKALAGILSDCGRPFGHRLNAAMTAYIANYPIEKIGDVTAAIADQIEFRIMPKLRGLSIDEHNETFSSLSRLLNDDVGDRDLAKRLNDVVERQGRTGGMFNWRGLTRSSGS